MRGHILLLKYSQFPPYRPRRLLLPATTFSPLLFSSFLLFLPNHATLRRCCWYVFTVAAAALCLYAAPPLRSKVALYIEFHSHVSIMLNFSVYKLNYKDNITHIIGRRLLCFPWLSLLCVASAACCSLFCSSFRDTHKDNCCFSVRLPWTFYSALHSPFFVEVE